MKRFLTLVLVVGSATLAGCGRAGDVKVAFRGTTPTTAAGKDARTIEIHCPVCGHPAPDGAQICTDNNCRAKLSWPDTVDCGYCGATGDCPTCTMMKQKDGKCYNCGGAGTLVLGTAGGVPIGKTRECPNCKGAPGKCPTCAKKPGKCDFCGGEKKVSMADCKKKVTEAKKSE